MQMESCYSRIPRGALSFEYKLVNNLLQVVRDQKFTTGKEVES